jgi:DNA repair exonuclease SbcCD nuclease subunit
VTDILRLLHVADVHLGTPFAGRAPELRERLRDAVKQAFGNAVEEALARRVDAVMIAGDLYEATTFSYADERWLTRQLARLCEAGIGVYYATGNHDPAGARHREIAWPAGLEVFAAREPRTVPLHRAGEIVLRVAGAGHESNAETTDLAAGFPAAAPGPPMIGLLHAQVGGAGAGRHARYAPTDAATLDSKGYAGWALGHVHQRQRLGTSTLAIYPGNVQGRDPTEPGPRGAALVELTPDGLASFRWLDLAPLVWLGLETWLDESVRDADEALEAIRRGIEQAVEAGSRERTLVRIAVSGRSPAASRLTDSELTAQLAREATAELGLADLEIVIGDLRRPVDVESRRGRPDVLGVALDLAAASRGEFSEALLDGAEEELVERFTRS